MENENLKASAQSQQSVPDGKMQVQVSSPEQKLYDGLAQSISSFNTHGPFDVLPTHENFISVIQNSVVVYDENGSPREFLLQNGVLRVSRNKVDVFVGF